MQKELEEAISRTQKIVFEKLNELVPEDSEILTQAIRYSLLCSGKRLRPLLVIESAKIFGDLDINDLITIACAVEMVHIFSLILDYSFYLYMLNLIHKFFLYINLIP